MKIRFVVASILLTCNIARSSVDVGIRWHTATIGFGPPNEKNVLRIAVNENNELTELVVHWKGHDLVVPPGEFNAIQNVRLDTVKILESGDPSYVYLNISLDFGDWSPDYIHPYPTAWFLFFPGGYDHLMMIKPTSKTTEDYIQKFPGEAAHKETTATAITETPIPPGKRVTASPTATKAAPSSTPK